VSLKRLAHDFAAEQLGLESKVPKTLWALISRPGFLTREYLAGRRARWVLPLKLYLSMSVVYFLLLSLPFAGNFRANVTFSDEDRAGVDSVAQERVITGATISSDTTDSSTSALERRLGENAKRISELSPEEQVARFREGFTKWMPNAIFLLLPVFAAILYLLYRRTGRFFAEHLIFALHIHAFVFAVRAVSLFLPELLVLVGQLWILVYLFLAMRSVYAEPSGRTAAKFVGLVVPYGVMLIAVTMLVMLAIFATV
jgi:hypothetical protein